MKVQDVSHRTGQGVGHTLVEVTEKHKDMAAGRGRRSKSQNPKIKKRCGRRGRRGQQQGMLQRVKKTRVDLGRNGGTWHREKVKAEEEIVRESGSFEGLGA